MGLRRPCACCNGAAGPVDWCWRDVNWNGARGPGPSHLIIAVEKDFQKSIEHKGGFQFELSASRARVGVEGLLPRGASESARAARCGARHAPCGPSAGRHRLDVVCVVGVGYLRVVPVHVISVALPYFNPLAALAPHGEGGTLSRSSLGGRTYIYSNACKLVYGPATGWVWGVRSGRAG